MHKVFEGLSASQLEATLNGKDVKRVVAVWPTGFGVSCCVEMSEKYVEPAKGPKPDRAALKAARGPAKPVKASTPAGDAGDTPRGRNVTKAPSSAEGAK